MSIVTEIERIKTNIANAYTTCEEKGATMPSVLNSANLVDCIASITGGGVAKQLSYYGRVSDLSNVTRYGASASLEMYAVFAGGTSGKDSAGTGLTTVNTYDKDLVKSTATALSVGRRYLAGASNGEHVIFAGGAKTGNVSTVISDVDAYTTELVKTTASKLSQARCFWNNTATNLEEYIFIGSGRGSTSTTRISAIDVYNANLVMTTLGAGENFEHVGATSNGEYAIFGGREDGNGNGSTTVDTYNKNLVRGTATDLSVARNDHIIAVSNKKYALFAGGKLNDGTMSTTVDTYDKNLIKGTATDLVVGREFGAKATINEYAIIAGGLTDSSGKSADVEAYNGDLVKTRLHNLTTAKIYLAGATVANYVLFAGGQSMVSQSNTVMGTVDAYELVG